MAKMKMGRIKSPMRNASGRKRSSAGNTSAAASMMISGRLNCLTSFDAADIRSDLFADFGSEQAGRPEYQDQNQNCEDDNVGPLRGDVLIAHGADDSDKQPAQKSAGQTSDSA